MRWRALVALLVLLLPVRAWGAIAIVGSDQVSNNAAASCASTFNMASRTVGSGNTLVVSIGSKGTSGAMTLTQPTDNNGGNWSCFYYAPGGGNTQSDAICVSGNHPSGATVVTIGYSGGTGTCNVNADLSEWSGLGTVVTLDVYAPHSGTGNTQSTGTTSTTWQANELAIAQDTAGNGNNVMNPTGAYTALTLAQSGSSSTGSTTATAYQILTSTQATSVTWNEAAGASYIADVVAIYGSSPTAQCGIQQVGTNQALNNLSAACSGSIILGPLVVGGSGTHLLAIQATTNGSASPKATISGVTDDNSGSWTCNSFQSTSSAPATSQCWAPNHASGATNVTVSYSGGTTECDVKATLSEWTGPSGTVALDQSVTNNTVSDFNPYTTATGLTTANYELALAVDEADFPFILYAGPNYNYTRLTNIAGFTHGTLLPAATILTFPQHTATGWNFGTSTTNAMQVITLKGSSNVCATAQSWFEP